MSLGSRIRWASLAATILCSSASAINAQTSGRTSVQATSRSALMGQVLLPGGQPVDRRIKIELSTLRDPGMSLYTDTNGRFAYDNLQPGSYTIEAIDDQNHYASAKEQIVLNRGQEATIRIYLRDRGASVGTSGGPVVSANEADQQIPSEAKREYERAQQSIKDGMVQEAIQHLLEAISLYPSYLRAHNDLGVQYLNLKHYQDAEDQFGLALEIDPKAFNPRLNLGIVLIQQGRHLAALDQLSQAVSVDSSKAAGHLYIGIAYLGTDNLETAERELMRALVLGESEYWAAHYYLAHVHLKAGDSEKAIHELETFLADAKDPQLQDSARQLLAKLKHR